MRKQKRRWVAGLAVLAVMMNSAAFADSDTEDPARQVNPEKAVERILETMEEKLDLTDEQVEALRPVWAAHIGKVAALRDKYAGQGFRGMRKARKEAERLRKANDARLEEILSEEQMQDFKELRGEMRAKMREAIRQRREAQKSAAR